MIEPFIGTLGAEFRAIQLKYRGVVSGVKAAAPRAESCVAIVNTHFPNAVGSLYVRNHFRKEAKEEVLDHVKILWTFHCLFALHV